MDTQRLQDFATAVGTDIKTLRGDVATKVTLADVKQEITNANNGVATTQEVTRQIEALKTEILGDGVPEELNTLKEIAEELSRSGQDTNGAVVQAVADAKTELNGRIDSIANIDLMTIYNSAKS